jgi:hypothetical protein
VCFSFLSLPSLPLHPISPCSFSHIRALHSLLPTLTLVRYHENCMFPELTQNKYNVVQRLITLSNKIIPYIPDDSCLLHVGLLEDGDARVIDYVPVSFILLRLSLFLNFDLTMTFELTLLVNTRMHLLTQRTNLIRQNHDRSPHFSFNQ